MQVNEYYLKRLENAGIPKDQAEKIIEFARIKAKSVGMSPEVIIDAFLQLPRKMKLE